MKSVQPERKTQIVNFDKNLRDLILSAPDLATRRNLNRALLHYRKQYFVPFDKKKTEVLDLIKLGASTFVELQAETGYATKTLHKILRALLDEQSIRLEKIKPQGALGGRPKLSYFCL